MPVVAEVDASEDPRIALTTEYHHREQAKTLPGASWSSKDGQWKLPLAWTSCLALRATFKDDLIISPSLQTWAWNEKTTRIDPAVELRELMRLDDGAQKYPYDESADPLVRDPKVPDTDVVRIALELQKELKLFPHQAVGAAFMATAMQCGIFDETGTGKSAQAVAALRILHRMGKDVFPALVIAPNTVKKTWERELATWWPGLISQVIGGSAAQRRKSLETPAHVYIMNWDSLAKHSRLAKYGNTALKRCTECGGLDERITHVQCEVHKRELNQLTFNTVIADEVHRAKSPTAKWTRALWAASEGATYRAGLTGTPIQDTISDLWAILRFISPSEYTSKTKFVDRFAETGFSTWGIFTIFGVRESAREEYDNGVNPRMRRMLKKIVLPFLPPIVRQTRFCEMSAAQTKAYKQMVKDTIAELDGGALVAMNPLSRATRLIQFSSAYAELITTDLADGRVDTHVKLKAPSNKVDAFIKDVQDDDYGDSSIVIFAQSRQLIDILADEMTRLEGKCKVHATTGKPLGRCFAHGLITGAVSTDDRQKYIDSFQAGEVKFILVTIDAGGVGLTLTKADTMVFLQRSFSSTAMKQAESRAHRIGSEIHETVTIVDYISQDTIEEKQILKLQGKYGRIESIVRDQVLLKKLLTEVEVDADVLPEEPEEPFTDPGEVV